MAPSSSGFPSHSRRTRHPRGGVPGPSCICSRHSQEQILICNSLYFLEASLVVVLVLPYPTERPQASHSWDSASWFHSPRHPAMSRDLHPDPDSLMSLILNLERKTQIFRSTFYSHSFIYSFIRQAPTLCRALS